MIDNTTVVYRITGRESLNILLTKRKNRYQKFIMDVANMDEIKAKNFENDLNKFHASCGCTTGQNFLRTSLVLCVAYILIKELPINNWEIIMQVGAIFLIVSFIGKLAGKLMDGYKFKKTVEKLSHELF